MTDLTGGPEREWYAELDEEWGLESGRVPHVESFPEPEAPGPAARPPSER